MMKKYRRQCQEEQLRKSLGTALVRLLRRIVATPRLTNRYRPERHYMRGPGPKSLAQTHPGIADVGAGVAAPKRRGS
jgi:hypothetical protein